MESIALAYLTLWKPIGYALFFVAMIFEGEVFLFTAFFLAQRGMFDLEYLALIIFGGATAGDFLWYRFGVWLNHSTSRVARWAEKISKPFDKHLLNNHFHTLLVSKFLYGMHHAVLMRAGTLKLDVKKFLKDDFVTNLIWIFVIGGLGYISGASFGLIKKYLRFAELTLLAGIIFFLLLEYLVARVSRKKIRQ